MDGLKPLGLTLFKGAGQGKSMRTAPRLGKGKDEVVEGLITALLLSGSSW